ncbi:MAG: signal peptidase I [Candidatus Howiella sp.]|jgi:signal peptidase I
MEYNREESYIPEEEHNPLPLMEENTARRPAQEVFEWLDAIVAAIVTVVLLFTFVFRVVGVDGTSMLQTLQDKDKVIISNVHYTPAYGDIVVISRNYRNDDSMEVTKHTEPIIKRVIATGGQSVDIDFEAGVVYVDGVALEESYVNTPTNRYYDIEFPVQVPEGYLFVMGDNRNGSLDSRSSEIGMVNEKYVLGKAFFRIWRDKEFRFSSGDLFDKLY